MSTQPQQPQAIQKVETSPLILQMAAEWKISPVTMINTLKATIFPQLDRDKKPVVVSNEQVIAFLQVCHEYHLNPWVKEIYAFPTKGGGIVPMVPIDGWATIINRNPNMDGIEFIDEWEMTPDGVRKSVIPFSTTCVIYRKDRSHPTKVTEYFHECKQPGKEPWEKWPARMLRHKAMIQCGRVAFSLSGIYDPDEAERIAEVGDDKQPITRPTRASATIEAQPVSTTVAQAAVAEQTTGEVSKGGSTAQHQPAPTSSGCFCACCKSGHCSCATLDEFNRCGCSQCKFNVGAPPVETVKNEPANENAGPSAQPTGGELFGPGPDAQSSKPAGPYITQKQLAKLVIASKASGIEVKKDDHTDAVHQFLLKDYGIASMSEIPQSLFEEILKKASNLGPVKLNAK